MYVGHKIFYCVCVCVCVRVFVCVYMCACTLVRTCTQCDVRRMVFKPVFSCCVYASIKCMFTENWCQNLNLKPMMCANARKVTSCV